MPAHPKRQHKLLDIYDFKVPFHGGSLGNHSRSRTVFLNGELYSAFHFLPRKTATLHNEVHVNAREYARILFGAVSLDFDRHVRDRLAALGEYVNHIKR